MKTNTSSKNLRVTIPSVPRAVLAAFEAGDEMRQVKQGSIPAGSVLRVYCAEEPWGSARVVASGRSFRLYEYKHQGEPMGKNGKFYYSVAEWLENFDEDSYKLGVKIAGSNDYVKIVA